MSQRHVQNLVPDRDLHFFGGSQKPPDQAGGMLRRAVQRALEDRNLSIKGVVEITTAAGNPESQADLEALRHWMAGRRNIRVDRVERALWALGITDADLAEVLQPREKQIWFVRINGSDRRDRQFVRADSEAEAIALAWKEHGIKPEMIEEIGAYDARRFSGDLAAGNVSLRHDPEQGVLLVPRARRSLPQR